MKECLSCGAQIQAGARFCPSCGASQESACVSCGLALPEGAQFCPSCGAPQERVPRGPTAPGEERRIVTVLFADVAGSTTLGERLDPEELREVMDNYFSAMREEIEAEGGAIEKFIGDAVVAVFGVPRAHEDDPARALRAALRMRERLTRVNQDLSASHSVKLEVRIGVNTGEVLARIDPQPGQAMVTGDAVNVAARLQAQASPGEILAAERTSSNARSFSFGRARSFHLKGREEPVAALTLLGEGRRSDRGIPGLHAPMVGRDSELALLESMYERVAREGKPSVVTVYGDPGVGKSRLTSEFLAQVEHGARPASILRGRCLPYGDGITYWPLAEILKTHAGVLDSDAPAVALDKVRQACGGLIDESVSADPGRAIAAAAFTVGLEDPSYGFETMDPKEVQAEVHAAWRSYFSALATEGPTVVVVEDIHWADPVLLDLIEEVGDRAEGPLLFLCPSRPHLTSRRPGWGGGRRNHASVALEPLTHDESELLVSLLLSLDDATEAARERILDRAEGNPFFLEEVIHRLIDEGAIRREGDAWVAHGDLEGIDIPDTVQGVIAARIDLLEPADKRALQAGAVIGRVFWDGSVGALLGGTDGTEALAELERRDLILSRLSSAMSGQREFIFKHSLIRDVAYESLPRRDRAEAHAAVARWIEATTGERAGEFAELLAYHYSWAVSLARETGNEPDEPLRLAALHWLLRASSDARRRQVMGKAKRFAEEAMEISRTDLERSDSMAELAEAGFAAYEGDLAWRYFAEAARLRKVAEPPDGYRTAYLAARACEMPLRWPGSMRNRLPEEEVLAMRELGMANLPEGDSEARVLLLGQAAAWPFGFPDRDWSDEELDACEAAGIEASEIALRLGMPNLASGVLDNAQGVSAIKGRYSRAKVLWDLRGDVMSNVTDILEVGDFWAMGSWMHLELGDFREAVRCADQGITAVAGRANNVDIHLKSWKVAALFRLGRWDEALACFDEAYALLDDRRDSPPYFATQGYASAARIRFQRGEAVEADRLLDILDGIEAGNTPGVYAWFLRLLMDRGDLAWASRLAADPPKGSDIHLGPSLEAETDLFAELGEWDRVEGNVRRMRDKVDWVGSAVMPAFADRLGARALLARGSADAAIPLLRSAAAVFDEAGDIFERAITDVYLSVALAATGGPGGDEAYQQAVATLTELRAHRSLDRARLITGRDR